MKVGELVVIKNVHKSWCGPAIVTRIQTSSLGIKHIHLLVAGNVASIPWIKMSTYIERLDKHERLRCDSYETLSTKFNFLPYFLILLVRII